jgi:tRNA splicing ligase
MEELLAALNKLTIKAKGRVPVVRSKIYHFQPLPGVSLPIRSWNVQDYAYKTPGLLPVNARGLFTLEPSGKIVIRGYDKFFNGTRSFLIVL